MTVAIPKKELISALDSGQVRYMGDQGDLTPQDVYQILHRNAGRLADSTGKYDVNIDKLFETESSTLKIASHHRRRKIVSCFSRTKN